MGAALSSAASAASAASATLSAPLSAQYKFPVVVNRRFCTPRTVLLELSDGFCALDCSSTDGFAVKEARSDRELFRLAPATAISNTLLSGTTGQGGDKWVLDGYGIAIARLRQVEHRTAHRIGTTTHSFTYEISIGTRNPHQLTTIQVTLSTANPPTDGRRFRSRHHHLHHHREPSLAVEFEDPQTGEQSRIGSAGDWERRRAAVLFLDRGAMTPRQAIAKVYRPDLDGILGLTTSSAFRAGSAYNVEIAPGVDAALILLICAAMDDAIVHAKDFVGRDDASETVATLGDDQDERRNSKVCTKGPDGDASTAVGLLRRIHHRLLPSRP